MTLQERQAVYEELGTMFVELVNAPEKGLGYVRERLTFCRAMQDRVGELLLVVNRAYAEACEVRLRSEQAHVLDPQAISKGQIAELKTEEAAHKLLVGTIKSQASLLSRTGGDIRLLADITKEQLKRGEINPEESPGLISDVAPADALPAIRNAGLGHTTATPLPPGGTRPEESQVEIPFDQAVDTGTRLPAGGSITISSTGLEDFSAVIAGSNGRPPESPASVAVSPQPAVSFVDMGSDQTSPEPYEPMRLPETAAVSFDDLFSEESQHGSPRPF